MSVAKKWGLGCGILTAICVGLLFGGLVLLGLFIEAGVLPDTLVQRGDEVSDRHAETLKEIGALGPDEELLYFYSSGFLSIKEDGNLLTDKRVVSYETWEGEFELASIPLEEITNIVVEVEGNTWEDAEIRVESASEDLHLFLSVEEGRDKEFLKALHAKWEEHRTITSPP